MRILATASACLALSVGLSVTQAESVAQSFQESVGLTYADQGWSSSERKRWYAATQGSRLMPASWFRALEVADGEMLFLDNANMRRFRFLFDESNPENLYPIGFAEDRQPDSNLEKTKLRWQEKKGGLFGTSFLARERTEEPWIGLNCSACHTAELRMGEKRFRVDGGPSIIDFQSFDEEIARALRETLDNEAKFARFAARVKADDPATIIPELRDALRQLTDWRETVVAASDSELRYGFSRLDAFGHIFNQVALFTGADNPSTQAADAPVSYPFLWNTPQHDVVQWNGIAGNGPRELGIDVGALGRNAGEVIGVFGEVNVAKRSGSDIVLKPRAYSSVSVNNLIEMERQIARLQSPIWPSHIFGELDAARVERGAELFKTKCSTCHEPLKSHEIDKKVEAKMNFFMPVAGSGNNLPAPNTDPVMACRAVERMTAAGWLYKGVKYEDEKGAEHLIGEEEKISTLLAAMVKSALFDQAGELIDFVLRGSQGLIVHNPGNYRDGPIAQGSGPTAVGESKAAVAEEITEAIGDGPFATPSEGEGRFASNRDWGPFNDCVTTGPSKFKAYKARPLNGIWATAPYLHNGSVPNLYQLLLPPAKRETRFYTGTYQFDVKHVGYLMDPSEENSFLFKATNDDGSVRWGNYNGGHDYGNAALKEEDRLDLVEYMKSL